MEDHEQRVKTIIFVLLLVVPIAVIIGPQFIIYVQATDHTTDWAAIGLLLIIAVKIAGIAVAIVLILLFIRWAIKRLPYVQHLRFRVYLDKPKSKNGITRRLAADGELVEVGEESGKAVPQSIEDVGLLH